MSINKFKEVNKRVPPVEYNDILEDLHIESIGSQGDGIGRFENYVIIVKDAKLGENVTCRILSAKENFAFAEII